MLLRNIKDFLLVKKELDKHTKDQSHSPSFPIKPPRLVHELREAISDDGIIALDNGVYKIWFSRNYKAYLPNTVLLDNALATMGAGLPSAMTAALIYPNRQVVSICGDGGFMMNSQELETAIRLKLNLTVIILRDDAYGMIKWKQAGMGFDNFGLDYGNPDFVKYAESYGARGYRIQNKDEIPKVVKETFRLKGVHLIDASVDYSENDRILNQDIKEMSKNLMSKLKG